MGTRRSVAALVLAVVAVVAAAAPSSADDSAHYRPPVDAPVRDPFREPKSAYGPGNRGLTYDLAPGTPVQAAGPGEVVFAGWVAGTQHVTVLHGDGLRTSYSFLEAISVRRGDPVRAGDVVGRAGPDFHFGVRDGDRYLDPASLFGRVEIRVRLVPHDEAAPDTDQGLLRERIALTATVREKGLLRRAVDWGLQRASQEVQRHVGALRTLVQLDPSVALASGVRSLWSQRRQECTAESATVPPTPARDHVAVLVAGYGSSSHDAAVDDVDTASLGFAPDDVLRFSYAGGRVPDPSDHVAWGNIPARPYEAEDTFTDLRAQGVALADLVEATMAARPGVPVDLVAHSQGGIVTRLALAELERRGRLDALGTVVTIGSPHRGVDLGTAAMLAGDVGRTFLEPVRRLTAGGVDADAPSVSQMSTSSSLVLGLWRDGVPDGVELRTIGASGDLVVPGDRTSVTGHPAAMVGLAGPRAHDALPGHAATTREVALALAGMAPGCRSPAEAIADAFLPELIGFAENSALVGLAAALPG